MPDGTDLVKLRQILAERFDEGELRTLCFDLRVDYQSLPGEGRADKARELVAYCDRHERIAELEDKVHQLRSPELEKAQAVLKECEEAATDNHRISG